MYHRDYKPQIIQGQMCIWLQAYGWCPAQKAENLKVGDVLVFNFGYTGIVKEVVKETAKTVTIKINTRSGDYEQKMKKATWKGVRA